MAKVEAIMNFLTPKNGRELMRCLGMAGYYRKFCPHFSVVAQPMTNLLRKDVKFDWTEKCQLAFDKIKVILISSPVLTASNFSKQFQTYL